MNGVKQTKPKQNKVSRPTHFLALRIEDSAVIANIHAAQQRFIERSRPMQDILTSTLKMHFTLLVLSLHGDDQIETALKTLVASYEAIVKRMFPAQTGLITVRIKGVSSFGANPRVIFASCEHSEMTNKLESFAIALRKFFAANLPPGSLDSNDHFDEKGVKEDGNSITLHCTLAKLRSGRRFIDSSDYERRGKHKRMKGIPQNVFSSEKETEFGIQKFMCIELCAMESIDSDGFYHSIAAIPFPRQLPNTIAPSIPSVAVPIMDSQQQNIEIVSIPTSIPTQTPPNASQLGSPIVNHSTRSVVNRGFSYSASLIARTFHLFFGFDYSHWFWKLVSLPNRIFSHIWRTFRNIFHLLSHRIP